MQGDAKLKATERLPRPFLNLAGLWILLYCLTGWAQAADFTIVDRDFIQYWSDMELRGFIRPISQHGFPTYRQFMKAKDSLSTNPLAEYQALRLPYSEENQARGFTKIKALSDWNGKDLSTIGDFRGGALVGQDEWSLVGSYYGFSGDNGAKDYYGYQWRGVKAKTDQVYLRWSGRKNYFQIGKDHLKYGLGMLLSGRESFEHAQAKIALGNHFNIYSFAGKIDGWQIDSVFVNRYISGHRAEIDLGFLQLGFNEVMIYGGPGRTMELFYLLPLYIFQGEQINYNIDDNAVWDADFKIMKPPFRLSGEISIDDFQIEKSHMGDNEPTEAGMALQFDWAIMSEPTLATLSTAYRAVTPWTYNQNKDWNRFLLEGQPMGDIEGNDFDRLSLNLTSSSLFWTGGAEIYYLRKGSGNISDPWTNPWYDPQWRQNFPSGIVERTTGLQLRFEWHLLPLCFWGLRQPVDILGSYSYAHKNNYLNIAGQQKDLWAVQLGIGYSLSGKMIEIDE